MSSEAPNPSRPDPGLPTVTPPSGSMFIRLFGVPALIVGGLVLLLILAQPLIGKFSSFLGRGWGRSSPEQFLRDLDNTNKEVRWRAADDLAQVLLRDDNLASDSGFALQLTQRLRRTLDTSGPFEKAHAEQFAKLSPEEEARERTKLEADRDYILLLAQCLSRFMVPVGAPVLEEMASQESGLDPRALNARRRQSLWALANLGDNIKRFDKLSPEQQESATAALSASADDKDARAALDYLTRRQEGRAAALGMDRVIEKCAAAEDPSLRELAAFAANFWSGDAGENARIDKTLLRLSNDTGKGEDELAKMEEQKPPEGDSLLNRFVEREETRTLVKKPGFRVQANATIALARRGGPARLEMLQAMLDEDELRSIFVVQAKNSGAERPDEAVVVETVLNALKAIAELHRQDPKRDLSRLQPNLDKLAHNPNPALHTEAGRVVLVLSK